MSFHPFSLFWLVSPFHFSCFSLNLLFTFESLAIKKALVNAANSVLIFSRYSANISTGYQHNYQHIPTFLYFLCAIIRGLNFFKQ